MKILLLRALLAGTSSFSFAQSRISATVASKLLTKKTLNSPSFRKQKNPRGRIRNFTQVSFPWISWKKCPCIVRPPF